MPGAGVTARHCSPSPPGSCSSAEGCSPSLRAWSRASRPRSTPESWPASSFTSLVATALAYLCWFGGLARLRAATVGVIGLLNPVTGVLLGAVVAHERLTLAQTAGIALVLTGIVAVSRRAPSAPRAAAEPVPTPGALVGARAA